MLRRLLDLRRTRIQISVEVAIAISQQKGRIRVVSKRVGVISAKVERRLKEEDGNQWDQSGSHSVVVPKQATEPLAAFDRARGLLDLRARIDQAIAQPLVVPFPMIMLKELANRFAQRHLAEKDHPVKALFLE